MRQAVLDVDHETLAEFGFTVFQDAGIVNTEILSCEGSRGVSRIQVEDPLEEDRLDEIDTIQWWERVSVEGSGYVYIVEMDIAYRLEEMGVEDNRIPLVEWAEIHDQGVTFEQAGSQEQLSTSMDMLDAAGIDITLHRLQDYRLQQTPLDALTDRQREVLDTAYDCGYYDVPRNSSTLEIADELGLDDSTVAEHLQRAEHNIIKALLD